MKVLKPGLQFYANRIASGKPFAFVRYGDGEWSAMLNDGRLRTGSGSQALNIPALQKDLRRSITQRPVCVPVCVPVCRQRTGRQRTGRPGADNYFMALRESSLKRAVSQWLDRRAGGITWHDCTVFYKASKKGQLNPLIRALRESELPKVVVGPPWLRKFNGRVFPVAAHIEVPARDCYRAKRETINRVLAFKKPAIISVSAGPAGKVLVRELFRHVGQQSFIIDLGSLWDVYCGRRSRQYMRGMKQETIDKNLRV